LIRSAILWIDPNAPFDPVAAAFQGGLVLIAPLQSGPVFVAPADRGGQLFGAALAFNPPTCPPNSNSSSKSAASISSAAPTAKSSSPPKPPLSTMPAKNSATPAIPDSDAIFIIKTETEIYLT